MTLFHSHRITLFATLFSLAMTGTILTSGIENYLSPAAYRLTGLSLLIVLFGLMVRLCSRYIQPRLRRLPPIVRYSFILWTSSLGAALWYAYPLAATTWYGAISQIIIAGLGMLVIFLFMAKIQKIFPVWLQFTAPVLVFGLYLLVGLAVYDDYGISVDERIQRRHGAVALKYALAQVNITTFEASMRSVPRLDDYPHTGYGVAFHMPLVTMEYLNDLSVADPTLWLFRHYATFLYFFFGMIVFYRLLLDKYTHPGVALAGTILLLLTPRIFAESFYNVKDTTFMMAFVMALYAGFRFWREPTMRHGSLFGVFIGIAINIRVVAIGLLPVPFAFLLLDLVFSQRRINKHLLAGSGLALLLSVITFFLFSPASWTNPTGHLINTLQNFTDFAGWDDLIMYMGEMIRGQNPPWHYLPVWMSITIPLSVLMLAAIGLVTIMRMIIRQKLKILHAPEREELLFVGLFTLPILAIIALNSTLYSAWRHTTFLYAPLLLIAACGLRNLLQTIKQAHNQSLYRYGALLLLAGGLFLYQINIMRWMIVNHPHQTVYFNSVVHLFGERTDFERDYWRMSIRQGLEYLLQTDNRQQITIAGEVPILTRSLLILPEEKQERLQVVDETAPYDYYIETYRAPPYGISAEVYHTIEVDGLPILTIYKVD